MATAADPTAAAPPTTALPEPAQTGPGGVAPVDVDTASAAAAAAVAAAAAAGAEPMRTLFVTGLPHDVTDREIWLLCRTLVGMEAHRVKHNPGKTPVAFVSFVMPQQALDAIKLLHGVKFDPASHFTLKVEMAKSNINKRDREQDAAEAAKRPRPADPFATAAYGQAPQPTAGAYGAPPGGSPYDPSGLWSQYYPGSAPAYGGYPAAGAAPMGDPSIMAGAPPGGMAGPPPTSKTLFVTGLGPAVQQGDVAAAFSPYPGYTRMKLMHAGEAKCVAFVEFQDSNLANYALGAMQGQMCMNSSRPLRIEFAKSDMRT